MRVGCKPLNMNLSRLQRLSRFVPRQTLPSSAVVQRLYSTSRKCPSCSTILPTALPTCPTCSHIESLPPSTSYFDLLDIPSSSNLFKIDVKQLKSQFLQAQRVCHPDTWSRKGFLICFVLDPVSNRYLRRKTTQYRYLPIFGNQQSIPNTFLPNSSRTIHLGSAWIPYFRGYHK